VPAAFHEPFAARRVIGFLQARQPLRSYDEPPRGPEGAVRRRVAALPEQFAAEVDTWIQVLRGTAPRPSIVTAWTTIRGYLIYVTPVLQD
jgi:hypothetical protein